MSKNIEINVYNGSGYEILYPQTTFANLTDSLDLTSNKLTGNLSFSRISNRIGFQFGSRVGNGDSTSPYSVQLPKAMNVWLFVLSDNKIHSFENAVRLFKKTTDTSQEYNSYPTTGVYAFISIIFMTNSQTLNDYSNQYCAYNKTSDVNCFLLKAVKDSSSISFSFEPLSGWSGWTAAQILNYNNRTYYWTALGEFIN